MVDSETLKNLMDALHKAFTSFPSGAPDGDPDDGENPKANKDPFGKGKSVTVISVSKADGAKSKIPKLSMKADKANSKSLGSGKSGGKGE